MTCWGAFPTSLAYNRVLAYADELSGQMVVSESQRLAYLKVMGVQAYFPRRPLPGARPVRQYAECFLSQSLVDASAPKPVASGHAPANVQDVLSMLVAKPPTEQAAPKAPVETPAPAPAPAPRAEAAVPENAASDPEPVLEGEEVRFVFAYFPINEQFAVINELPWSKTASVSPSCRKLLADILKALGVDVPERNLNPMVFTWPIFEGAPADLNSENARQTLEGFVSKRLRLLPVKTLLVFAEQSAQLLFPRDFLAEKGPQLKQPRHEVDVVLTHSLNAMEAVPDLKKAVWKTLQPLRGQLSGSSGDSQDGVA